MWTIGVDVGGTFTDVVLMADDGAQWDVEKVPSSPHDLSEACQAGIQALLARHSVSPSDVRLVVHGTTAPLNALLQRRGARSAMVTTSGFHDIIEIGRQTRPDRYNFRIRKPDPLIPRDLRFEVNERTLADGQIRTQVDPEELRALADRIRALGIEAIAICFLNSYANATNEATVAAFLQEAIPETYVSRSSTIANEFREFERFMTTVINAYIGPVGLSYFDAFQSRLQALGISAKLAILQSNGGVNTVRGAQARPVSLLMSGPAAGVIACAQIGRLAGYNNLITLDMGGTSCDVAVVVNGEPLYTTARTINGYPIRVPMIDVHSIGAGGGSIAWIDTGGLLRVGPQSAGSVPGPVAYDRGGTEPTVTDANLVLGRLNADAALGGRVKLRRDIADTAIATQLARHLDMSTDEVASGIIDIVNANMARAVRVMTVERGLDPREFTLVPYGGAGPLHACDLADELGISNIMIPAAPGGLCALGALVADFRFDFVQTQMVVLNEETLSTVRAALDELRCAATRTVEELRMSMEQFNTNAVIDMRYLGQNYELPIAADDYNEATFLTHLLDRFHREHERMYGYAQPQAPVQAVNYRLTAMIPSHAANFERFNATESRSDHGESQRQVYMPGSGWQLAPILRRAALSAGEARRGPFIIEQSDTTIMVSTGWRATADAWGNLTLVKDD